jgi:chaperone modulatory protein CbpM
MSKALLTISFTELCEFENITEEVIIQVVEYGIALPIEGDSSADWVFDATSVCWLKKAVRLYQDLQVDWVAVAMVIDLLQQKEALQKENEYFQRQLERFL